MSEPKALTSEALWSLVGQRVGGRWWIIGHPGYSVPSRVFRHAWREGIIRLAVYGWRVRP
jgi:hypothetical protein